MTDQKLKDSIKEFLERPSAGDISMSKSTLLRLLYFSRLGLEKFIEDDESELLFRQDGESWICSEYVLIKNYIDKVSKEKIGGLDNLDYSKLVDTCNLWVDRDFIIFLREGFLDHQSKYLAMWLNSMIGYSSYEIDIHESHSSIMPKVSIFNRLYTISRKFPLSKKNFEVRVREYIKDESHYYFKNIDTCLHNTKKNQEILFNIIRIYLWWIKEDIPGVIGSGGDFYDELVKMTDWDLLKSTGFIYI